MYLIDKLLNKSNIPHVFYLPDSGFRLTENHTFHCGGVELKYKSCQNISFYNKRNALEITKYLKESENNIMVIKGIGTYVYDRDVHELVKKIAILENSCRLLSIKTSFE